MAVLRLRFRANLLRREDGTALVEFALVSGILLLVIVGIMDFGHAWFVQQAITNASREEARYAVVYQTKTVGINIVRKPPSEFTSPTVPEVATEYLNNILPSGSYNVVYEGVGYYCQPFRR